MKINLHSAENEKLKQKLVEALAKLGEIDPEGKLFDALGAKKELTSEDKERIARAEAKRARRAQLRQIGK